MPEASWTRHGLTYRLTVPADKAENWNARLHPRDRDGQFVETGSPVRLLNGRRGTFEGVDNRSGRIRVRVGPNDVRSVLRSQVTFPDDGAPKKAPPKRKPATARPGRAQTPTMSAPPEAPAPAAAPKAPAARDWPDADAAGYTESTTRSRARPGDEVELRYSAREAGLIGRNAQISGKQPQSAVVTIRGVVNEHGNALAPGARWRDDEGNTGPVRLMVALPAGQEILRRPRQEEKPPKPEPVKPDQGETVAKKKPPAPKPAPKKPGKKRAPVPAGTLPVDMAESQRKAIDEYNWDSADSPETLREAAAQFRLRQPLSAEHAEALADAVRAQAAQPGVKPVRQRALLKAGERFDTVTAHLRGIDPKHVPARTGVEKVSPDAVNEGDTIALPGRGGKADIRTVVSSRPWYRLHEVVVEDENGVRETRFVTPTTDMYLLPDLPDPVPVPPERKGPVQEHVLPDRLAPGDKISFNSRYDEYPMEVVSVTPKGPMEWDLVYKTASGPEEYKRVLTAFTGTPSVVRFERGPGSQSQEWSSVLPDEDPKTVKARALRPGDRIRYAHIGKEVGGVIESIVEGREGNRKTLSVAIIGDSGARDTRNFYLTDEVTRTLPGDENAAARVQNALAQARQRVVASEMADAFQKIDKEVQDAVFNEGRFPVVINEEPNVSQEELAKLADAAITKRFGAPGTAVSDEEVRNTAWKAASPANVYRFFPSVNEDDRASMQDQLEGVYADIATRARDRARERVLATIRDSRPTDPRHVPGFAAALALDVIKDDPDGFAPADYARPSEALTAITPALKKQGAVGELPSAPTLPPDADLKTRVKAYQDAMGTMGQETLKRKLFSTTTLEELEAGDTPKYFEVDVHTTRRADDGGPSEHTMAQLAIIRAAGADLDAELQRRMEASKEAEDQKLKELQARSLELHKEEFAAMRDAKEAFAKAHGFDSWDDLLNAKKFAEGAERSRLIALIESGYGAESAASGKVVEKIVEITSQLGALMKSNTKARADRAADQRKHVIDILGEIRAMGGENLEYNKYENTADGISSTAEDDAKMAKAMEFAEAGYPTDWLNMVKSDGPYKLGLSNRGFHNDYYRVIVLSPESVKLTGAPEMGRVADHELGHGMEARIPGLLAAEEAFLWSRTSTGKIGSRKRTAKTTIYAGTKEEGYRDDFVEHYTGKDYLLRNGAFGAGEVFTTGKESLTAGSEYLDDDMRQWMLGVLALL